MTTRLQTFHGRPVSLRVLDQTRQGDLYSRLIALTLEGTDDVVEVGIARIDLGFTTDEVRRAILEQGRPLGEILIGYDVLRRIEAKWFLRFEPDAALVAHFARPLAQPVYGRLGVIDCEGVPAIELLEVVRAKKVSG